MEVVTATGAEYVVNSSSWSLHEDGTFPSRNKCNTIQSIFPSPMALSTPQSAYIQADPRTHCRFDQFTTITTNCTVSLCFTHVGTPSTFFETTSTRKFQGDNFLGRVQDVHLVRNFPR